MPLVGIFGDVRNFNSITGRIKHVFFFLGGGGGHNGGYMCKLTYRMGVLDKQK